MKRNGPEHPKTICLADHLDIPLYAAVGVLECLWHFTADFVPDGGIGRYPDDMISRKIGWQKEPSALIHGLVKAGFLDPSENGVRLMVHDWPDHCDDMVHSHLARQVKYFADGTKPKLTRLQKEERRRLEEAYDAMEAQNGAERRRQERIRPHTTERPALADALPLPMPMPMPEPRAGAGSGADAPEQAPPAEVRDSDGESGNQKIDQTADRIPWTDEGEILEIVRDILRIHYPAKAEDKGWQKWIVWSREKIGRSPLLIAMILEECRAYQGGQGWQAPFKPGGSAECVPEGLLKLASQRNRPDIPRCYCSRCEGRSHNYHGKCWVCGGPEGFLDGSVTV